MPKKYIKKQSIILFSKIYKYKNVEELSRKLKWTVPQTQELFNERNETINLRNQQLIKINKFYKDFADRTSINLMNESLNNLNKLPLNSRLILSKQGNIYKHNLIDSKVNMDDIEYRINPKSINIDPKQNIRIRTRNYNLLEKITTDNYINIFYTIKLSIGVYDDKPFTRHTSGNYRGLFNNLDAFIKDAHNVGSC